MEKVVAAVEHPGPVDAVVDEGGELVDVGVVVEVGAGGEDAAEEQRGVDGGDFVVGRCARRFRCR